MARSSWRSSVAAALIGAAVVWATGPLSAHRRDEYLQAARIAIDPGRIEVEIGLTPGIAVAPAILSDIDRNADGTFSDDEMASYVTRVLAQVRLDVDGQPAPLLLIDRRFPAKEAMLGGEASITLRLTATTPSLRDGAHALVFTNDHRPETGAYLANALMPTDQRVSIQTQRRDVNQRTLAIDYTIGDASPFRVPWWLAAGVVIGLASIADAIRRRKR